MIDEHKMGPPPPGSVQLPHVGDKPINAEDGGYCDDMVHICCVLHGEWPRMSPALKKKVPNLSELYVENLYSMVSRYAPRNQPWRFVCFTDRPAHLMPDIPTRELPDGVRGWFAKLYLFSREAFPRGARVLFFDLDTAITGDLSPLCRVPLDRPVFLRDVWAASMPASGVLSFRAGDPLTDIWEDFRPLLHTREPYVHPKPRITTGTYKLVRVVDGVKHIENVAPLSQGIRTDEQWIHNYVLPNNWQSWQSLLPQSCLSFKYDILGVGNKRGARQRYAWADWKPKPENKVVFFHQEPRPHDVIAPWNPMWRHVHDPIPPTEVPSGI